MACKKLIFRRSKSGKLVYMGSTSRKLKLKHKSRRK